MALENHRGRIDAEVTGDGPGLTLIVLRWIRPTLVKKGATIGANATIVCGATIGRYAIVAAGAVVKADVPDYAVVAGIPARRVGWACKCGTTLKADGRASSANGKRLKAEGETVLQCTHCGNEYGLDHDRFTILKET